MYGVRSTLITNVLRALYKLPTNSYMHDNE